MKNIQKMIIKNFWIKLFCFIAAIFLWVYVAAGQNSVGKFPGSIKIKAVNVPSGLVATYDTKTVDIKIMAEPSVWRKLSADSFSAYVDLSPYSEGTYEARVNVASTESGVQIVEKTPEKIFVNLEPVVTKDIEINSKIEGSAGDGLIVGEVAYEPQKIQARGPKSLINNLTEAFVTIKLDGESADFSKVLPPQAFDDKNEVISGIDFLPSSVTANVSIVKASNNKTVGIKVKTTGLPQSGFFVSSISVTPSTVDVTGPKSVMAGVNFVETNIIDITGASSNIDKDISLNLQNGLVLQSGSSNKVRVKIIFSESEVFKEITPTIIIKNLNGYNVKGYSSNQVKAVVTGQAKTISNLNSAEITLNLNFDGKTLSENVEFDIISNISAPSGVSISNVSPQTLTVFLEKNI